MSLVGTKRVLLRPAPSQGVGASLASLFANGEDGFLFPDFADLTRQFTLSMGAPNVAVDGDPEGLALETHGWGGKTLDQWLSTQPELIVPGTWQTSVGGGASTASENPAGQININADGTNVALADQVIATTPGKTYRLSYYNLTSGTVSVGVGTAQGANNLLGFITVSGPAAGAVYFTAGSTQTYIRFSRSATGLRQFSQFSAKLVPGNHALQATGTKRPFWRANGGKPYLQPDGTDDILLTPFAPTAGAGTLACAFRAPTGTNKIILGGQNNRFYIATSNAPGSLNGIGFGWGGEGTDVIGYGSSIAGQDHVAVLTGDATSRDLWLDGVMVISGPPSGTPNSSPVGIGGAGNGGTGSGFSSGNIYAALALNRRVTAAEIATITSKLRSTYQ